MPCGEKILQQKETNMDKYNIIHPVRAGHRLKTSQHNKAKPFSVQVRCQKSSKIYQKNMGWACLLLSLNFSFRNCFFQPSFLIMLLFRNHETHAHFSWEACERYPTLPRPSNTMQLLRYGKAKKSFEFIFQHHSMHVIETTAKGG